MQTSLFDKLPRAKTAAKEQRDAALNRVASNSGEFVDRALAAIQSLPRGDYIGEEIRNKLIEQGIKPHHPNAWGALINTAQRRGYIKKNGKWRSMQGPKSHARATPEYSVN